MQLQQYKGLFAEELGVPLAVARLPVLLFLLY